LRVNRERVQDLKLHRSPPQRVLDLGCGGGFFLFILKRFGHSVLGLDLDESSLFKELLEVFRVPRTVFRIQPFESLPNLHQQFDWITAFSIGFDRYRATNSRWGPGEWDFLLRDLLTATRAWRQNLSHAQSTTEWRLSYIGAAGFLFQARRRHRARTDLLH